ncbi:alpha/beta fold hydrolase [Vitreoscilla stercoraria]|uniref:Alpha/beta fold hydrolase n=1 Tax=Vitreoscilla stercoraria TaxID=61 RepID=A0ABY4EAE3_VITST|nr:alpha/beta fold hydrolase [Vitreoscilla stercoraria]UOO92360.1 alpha/beta fold hydrolase [Vitreoscilla stercoraria]
MYLTSPVLLLHGWAANHHVYDDFRQYLPTDSIWAPDLPGHGDHHETEFDAAVFADQLAAQMDEAHHIVAWSLGGQVALQLAARHPDKVKTLCLCATFAKLLQTEGYDAGLVQSKLLGMIPVFQADYGKTMTQFLQLQILYTPERKAAVEAILPATIACGVPAGLHSAQQYASAADARSLLAHITTPTLCVFGDKDTITPVRLGEYLAAHLPNAQLLNIPKAVHAPFISHPDVMANALIEFWNTHEA